MSELIKPEGVSNELWQFATIAYRNHDKAHGLDHAIKVLENAIAITAKEGIEMTYKEYCLFICVMLMHDARDHKQKNCLDSEMLYEFYKKYYGNEYADVITHIHANCSWSKRHDSSESPGYEWMRKVLQDADWMEAMGYVGITRCQQYQTCVHPGLTVERINQYVVDHIHEKLLRIHRHINFAASRKMVYEMNLVEPLEQFLKEHDITTD